MTVRWGESIRASGYRVVITPVDESAEEVIEVYIPKVTAPTFKVRRSRDSIVVTDCIGLTLSFPDLVGALLALSPQPKPRRREMLQGTKPAWLPCGCVRTQDVSAPPRTWGASLIGRAMEHLRSGAGKSLPANLEG